LVLVACTVGSAGAVYMSPDFGATWLDITPASFRGSNFFSITASIDGCTIATVIQFQAVLISKTLGSSWKVADNSTTRSWTSITMNSAGKTFAVASYNSAPSNNKIFTTELLLPPYVCPSGFYYSDDFSCTPCPVGTASMSRNATSAATCVPCSPGYFAPIVGSSVCSACYANTIAPNSGQSACTVCPAGKFSYNQGIACDTSILPYKQFGLTNSPQSFLVPFGIRSLIIDACGASSSNYGGYVQAQVSVTPGSTLFVYVGGKRGNCYNGGGSGNDGGGGGTDIRFRLDDLYSRFLVAGGAAANWNYQGGAGGGLVGE